MSVQAVCAECGEPLLALTLRNERNFSICLRCFNRTTATEEGLAPVEGDPPPEKWVPGYEPGTPPIGGAPDALDETVRTLLAMDEVLSQLTRDKHRHHDLNSAHEGWSLLMEEIHELTEDVFAKVSKYDWDDMRHNCLEVCARAMRLIIDIVDFQKPEEPS